MATRYFGSGVAIPVFDEEGPKGPSLIDAIVEAILKESDIVQAILNWKKSKAVVDMDGFYNYGKTQYGLPRMTISGQPLSNSYDGEETEGVLGYEISSVFSPYPIIELRTNATQLSKSSPRYATGDKALNYLSLGMDNLVDSIGESPEIDSIDDAVLGINIPLLTEDPKGKEFLFAYFSKLERYSQYNITQWQDKWVEVESQPNPNEKPIVELINWNYFKNYNYLNYFSGEFKVSLAYFYIQSFEAQAEGIPGTITTDIVLRNPITVELKREHNGNDPTYVTPTAEYDANIFYIEKQITATTRQVIEIRGLQHRTYIHNKAEVVPVTLRDLRVDPDVAQNFYIPLDHEILKDLFTEEEIQELVLPAVTLNINALERVKLKWYETGIFKALITFVGIALAIISYGFLGGVAVALISMVATPLLEQLDPEIALAVSLVIALVTMGQSLYATIQQGITLTVEALLKLGTSVLSMVTDIAAKAMDLYLYYKMEGLAEENEEFQTEAEKLQKEIDEAEAAFGSDRLPFNYIGQPYFDPNETPDQFYTRTLEVGSNVDAIYQAVDLNSEIALQLPEFKGTLTTDSNYSLNI